jgi:RNA polymerase sigma-70 factor (TIGR02960 family)
MWMDESEDAVVVESRLARAKAGDADAFREISEPYRRELHVHCYRIVGSLEDAEDLVQETLLAAWRGLERFEERASLRSWLYRIATNRCLNALRASGRRPREVHVLSEPPTPTRRAEPSWLEPYPDSLLEGTPDVASGPESRYETRETIGLAFVATLQWLPPQQRVVFVLRDVLGYRTGEVSDLLDTSPSAVKSALQRARATVRSRLPRIDRDTAPLPRSARERKVVAAFASASEAGDIDAMVSLLTDDAWLTMPPQPYEYQGHTAIAAFLHDRARLRGGRALRLVPTRANGQPAFGCYLPDPHAAIAHSYGLVVLTLEGDRISAVTWFGDNSVFAWFGLPRTLRDDPRD